MFKGPCNCPNFNHSMSIPVIVGAAIVGCITPPPQSGSNSKARLTSGPHGTRNLNRCVSQLLSSYLLYACVQCLCQHLIRILLVCYLFPFTQSPKPETGCAGLVRTNTPCQNPENLEPGRAQAAQRKSFGFRAGLASSRLLEGFRV